MWVRANFMGLWVRGWRSWVRGFVGSWVRGFVDVVLRILRFWVRAVSFISNLFELPLFKVVATIMAVIVLIL